jgi:hypothetical protein
MTPERLRFEFADRELEGTVIDSTIDAGFNRPPERVYTVVAGDSRYTVSEADATLV